MKLLTSRAHGGLLALLLALGLAGAFGISVTADFFPVQCTEEFGCVLPGDPTADTYLVNGSELDDLIVTGVGPDQIYGNNGCDDITSDDGDDTIFGGPGSDYIDSGDGADKVWPGSTGPCSEMNGEGPYGDTVYTGAGDDKVTVSLFDVLLGDETYIDCGDDEDQVNFAGFGEFTGVSPGPGVWTVVDPETGGEIFVSGNCEFLNGLPGDAVFDPGAVLPPV